MKLYCNQDKKQIQKTILGFFIFSLVLFVPMHYLLTDLYIPFTQATNEYVNFVGNDKHLDRFIELYKAGEFREGSNLDKPSMMLFMSFVLMGGLLIPVFVLFAFIIITVKSTNIILVWVKLYSKEGLHISRKPFENQI